MNAPDKAIQHASLTGLIQLFDSTARCDPDASPSSENYTDNVVRRIQERQGLTACFKTGYPPGCQGRRSACFQDSCIWFYHCQSTYNARSDYNSPPPTENAFIRDITTTEDSPNVKLLRETLHANGLRLNCIEKLRNLIDFDAVRTLQMLEGHKTCFGNTIPLHPSTLHLKECAEAQCTWKPWCDRCRGHLPTVSASLTQIKGNRDVVPQAPTELPEWRSHFMRRFFENVQARDKDEALARAYLGYVQLCKDEIELQTRSSAGPIATISVASDESSFDFISKRLPIITAAGTLSHATGIEQEVFSFDDDAVNWDCFTSHTRQYVDCPDLQKLGAWLRACKPLIESGDLFYLPNLRTENFQLTNSFTQAGEADSSPLWDALIKNRRLAQIQNTNSVKANFLRRIVSIHLPSIENVSMADFAKLTVDERAHFEKFRLYLTDRFLELSENEGKESSETGLVRIGNDIKRNIKQLERDFRGIQRSRRFQLLGAGLSTVGAVLCAYQGNIAGLGSALMGSSGVYLLFKAAEEAETKRWRASDNPCYYLWLLERYSEV